MFRGISNKRGVALLWTAVVALVLFAIGAFAVDLGNLWLVRNELQNTADSAALAAASALGADTYREVYARARAWAAENTADGEAVNLNFEDIEVGKWDFETRSFSPSDPFAVSFFENNAVRVKAARTRNSNGPIQLCFGRLLGQDAAEVSADAIAVGKPANPVTATPANPTSPGEDIKESEDEVCLPSPNHGGYICLPRNMWEGLSPEIQENVKRGVELDPYVMYVMDTTDSMSGAMDEGKTLAQALLNWSETAVIGKLITKVGLVSFESEPTVEQDLSSNVGAVYEKVDELRYGQVYPENVHNVAGALRTSLERLWNEPRGEHPVDKYAYLFSDGRFSEEETAEVLAEARKAQAGRVNKEGSLERIPIFTFGIGDDVNEEALQKIAEESGGEYLSGADALALCRESMDNFVVWLVK